RSRDHRRRLRRERPGAGPLAGGSAAGHAFLPRYARGSRRADARGCSHPAGGQRPPGAAHQWTAQRRPAGHRRYLRTSQTVTVSTTAAIDCLGVSHRTAAIALREQLNYLPAQLEAALLAWRAAGRDELVILS